MLNSESLFFLLSAKNTKEKKLISTFMLSIFLFSFNRGGQPHYSIHLKGIFFSHPAPKYHLHTRILYCSCKSLFSSFSFKKKKKEKEKESSLAYLLVCRVEPPPPFQPRYHHHHHPPPPSSSSSPISQCPPNPSHTNTQ